MQQNSDETTSFLPLLRYIYPCTVTMFRFVVVFAILAVVAAFGPAGRFGARSLQMTSANKQIAKAFSAVAVAASLAGALPANAVEGAGPKFSFFGMGGPDTSSPFVVNEDREVCSNFVACPRNSFACNPCNVLPPIAHQTSFSFHSTSCHPFLFLSLFFLQGPDVFPVLTVRKRCRRRV